MTLFLWFLFASAIIIAAIFTPKYLNAQRYVRNNTTLKYKMICSTMFLSLGAISAIISKNTSPYAAFMLIGLVFSWFGDFFIHTKGNEFFFVLGVAGFLTAHVFYLTAYQNAIKHICGERFFKVFHAGCLIVILTLLLCVFFLTNTKVKKQLFFMLLIYALVLSTMMIKAIDLAIKHTKHGASLFEGALLIVGSFFFFASDVSLAILMLKKEKERFRLKCFNIITYFSGQLMLASTILFFNNKIFC